MALGGKIGTPDARLAIVMPKHMREMVPTILNRKTTSAMETVLLNDVFLCTQATTRSKYAEIAIDKPRRRGRITLLKTKKPAYTAMNGFH